MAKHSGKVIPFPNSIAKEDQIRMREARLEELEWENSFLHNDKREINSKIDANANEIKQVLKELAVLCEFETKQDTEFMPDFDIDFDLNFNPEEDK
tara:strand:- start:235 stop:522 length:288 start_codon:yes stop_codon:yes gene_type:complete